MKYLFELSFKNLVNYLDSTNEPLFYKVDKHSELVVQKQSGSVYTCRLLNHYLKRDIVRIHNIIELERYLIEYDLSSFTKRSDFNNVIDFKPTLRLLQG